LGFFHHKSPDVKYIQDGLYAGYRTMMTTGDIMDKFGEFLTDSDIERLEGDMSGVNGVREDLVGKSMKYHSKDPFQEWERNLAHGDIVEGQYGRSWREHDWVVSHVEWKSQKRVGFLSFVNEQGEEETIIVSEDFEIP